MPGGPADRDIGRPFVFLSLRLVTLVGAAEGYSSPPCKKATIRTQNQMVLKTSFKAVSETRAGGSSDTGGRPADPYRDNFRAVSH